MSQEAAHKVQPLPLHLPVLVYHIKNHMLLPVRVYHVKNSMPLLTVLVYHFKNCMLPPIVLVYHFKNSLSPLIVLVYPLKNSMPLLIMLVYNFKNRMSLLIVLVYLCQNHYHWSQKSSFTESLPNRRWIEPSAITDLEPLSRTRPGAPMSPGARSTRPQPELIRRFEGGALPQPPDLPHCHRWNVQRGANADQAWWQCQLCSCILMRVGRRHPGDEQAWFDVEPCEKAAESLNDPSLWKPEPVRRSKTTTGIATPEYPWPEASKDLEGLIKPGDRDLPRPKAKSRPTTRVRDPQGRFTREQTEPEARDQTPSPSPPANPTAPTSQTRSSSRRRPAPTDADRMEAAAGSEPTARLAELNQEVDRLTREHPDLRSSTD